jgi:hypothetical protein
MSEELNKVIYDHVTGETVTVPLTEEEVAAHIAATEAFVARLEEERIAAETLAALKESARAKLVSGEPLTAEEAATLVV